MPLIKIDTKQQKILYGLTFVLLLLGAYFLRNFLMLILFSAVMAILFNPVYSWLLKKGKSPGSASFYTFCISIFAIIIPATLIGIITFFQIQNLVDTIANGGYTIDLDGLGTNIVDSINETLANLGVDYVVSIEQIASNVSTAAATFSKELFNDVVNAFSGFFGFITAAIIYIYVFLSMLKNRDVISTSIEKLNPLGNEVTSLYVNRVTAMTKATVRGQFIIALMQGIASAAVLAIVGFNSLFFFFLLLLTVMSIIPLGAGIITIPIGVVMMLTGNITGGIIVIANHLLLVTNIDNVMRPKLVPKSARLDPALMILAVFSGLALYGFIGIVLGPIIMILIVTTLQIFNEVFYKEETIDRTVHEKSSSYKKLRAKISRKK